VLGYQTEDPRNDPYDYPFELRQRLSSQSARDVPKAYPSWLLRETGFCHLGTRAQPRMVSVSKFTISNNLELAAPAVVWHGFCNSRN